MEADRGGMNSCNNMVIYDHWSYVTIFDILEVVFSALWEVGGGKN